MHYFVIIKTATRLIKRCMLFLWYFLIISSSVRELNEGELLNHKAKTNLFNYYFLRIMNTQ